jgi:hypothetical protein
LCCCCPSTSEAGKSASLVNPGLEEVWLGRDGDGWHPRLDPGFAAAGLTPPTAGISIGIPASGLTGRLADGCLSTGIAGRTETYQTWAEAEIRAYARRDGGFLLIVTHAAPPPAQLTPDGLDQALASPLTLAGWAGPRHRSRDRWLLRDLRRPGGQREMKEPRKEPAIVGARPLPAPASRSSVQLDDTPDTSGSSSDQAWAPCE